MIDPSRPFPHWEPSFAAALEQLAIRARRPATGLPAGETRSRRRGRALEFADHRPYAPGDDPRLVDWRAYARLGRLHLKQYDEEHARTITLLIDASASMDFGDGAEHKGRYARRLAAALVWIARARGEPVRPFLARAGQTEPLPLVAAGPSVAACFRLMSEVREDGPTGLAAAVRAARRGRTDGPTLLLTDLLDPDWEAALDALATGREGQSEGIVLQLLAPAEWEPPLGEEVELEDAETGERRATRLGPVELRAYRARRDAFLAAVRARCRRNGLPHLALSTSTPLRDAVLRQLPAAGILGPA